MIYRGTIILDRELSFTQAERIKLFALTMQKDRRYNRAGLLVGIDGKSIMWDNDKTITGLEYAITDLIHSHFIPWKITCTGIIRAIDTEQQVSFDIVVLKNKVKTLKNNVITNVQPNLK